MRGKCFLFFYVCHVSSQKPVVLQTILPCSYLHEFSLILGAICELHDPDSVGKTLLELAVVNGSVAQLHVAHSTLDTLHNSNTIDNTVVLGFRALVRQQLINSIGPELPSGPLDDTVKFTFNREI